MIRWARICLVVIALIVGIGLTGCADDLYGECSIEPESGDVLESCLEEGENSSKSCVVQGQHECQTGTCGRYRGSAPFCTSLCSSDEDCPSGECREFVFQSGERYCVAFESLD